jgi:phospholipid/cholesterol/gamma-HCH transport system substrate-binding protein
LKISKEIKTGLVVLVSIALFIWGFSYIQGENLFEKSRVFYAEYDNVQGLQTSGGVTINGLKVGKIDNISFHPKKIGRLVVKFSLENEFQFSKTSIAQIYSPDFISGKSIKILPSFDGAIAVSGDTLVANVEIDILGSIGNQLVPLEAKISSFVANADSLLKSFNEVFDQEGKTNLKQALAKLNTTLSTFNNAGKSISYMMADGGKIDSILQGAQIASNNLADLTDSLNNANLAGTIKKLESTLNSFNNILKDVDSGKGSIGKLIKDDGLYNNLEGATKEMEALLREMKLNPKRFVHFSLFGKKPKPYKTESEEQKE